MNSQLVRRVVLVVVIIGIAVAAIPAYHYYRYIESHVSTDDAYADGTVALVSSRVAGTVTNVYVEDNWTVKEGQLLLSLDQNDFDVRVDQAQAQLERARQSVDELYAGVQAAKSGVALTVSQRQQAQISSAARILNTESRSVAERRPPVSSIWVPDRCSRIGWDPHGHCS